MPENGVLEQRICSVLAEVGFPVSARALVRNLYDCSKDSPSRWIMAFAINDAQERGMLGSREIRSSFWQRSTCCKFAPEHVQAFLYAKDQANAIFNDMERHYPGLSRALGDEVKSAIVSSQKDTGY